MDRRSLARIALFALPLTSIAAPALAEQIIVDPRGAGDATTLQEGVDLAAEGDVILVLPGHFEEQVLLEKGVWIVPQQSGTVSLSGEIHVRGLARGSQTTLIGLRIDTRPFGVDDAAVHVESCEGLVTLHDCDLTGDLMRGSILGGAAVLLEGARRVNVVDCVLATPDSQLKARSAAEALQMSGSRAAVWGTSVIGGDGLSSVSFGSPFPSDGADGVRLESSDLFLSGADVHGGDGGSINDIFPIPGRAGGDAVHADAGSRVFIVDTTLEPGTGGDPGFGGPQGPNGSTLGGAGFGRFLPGAAQVNTAERWGFVGGSYALTIRGDVGSDVLLHLTAGQAPFLFDAFGDPGPVFGAPGFALPSVVGHLGTIPASGALAATVQIPAIPSPPGIATGTFFATSGRAGRALFGAPMPVVAVDCSALLPDCDASGTSDLCEIIQGLRPDANLDGLVDGCAPDCNGNGVADADDIAGGFSADLNGNLVPDECEPASATWVVTPGAGPGGDGSATAPFASLAEARQVCLPGHEIVLTAGLHSGDGNRGLDFPFADFILRGESGPLATIIDLEEVARGLAVTGPGTVEIRGLTFRRGAIPHQGGGAIRSEGAHLVVRECIFEENRAAGGGAIQIDGGSADIRRSRFLRNLDGTTGLVASGGAVAMRSVGPDGAIIDDCLFQENRSPAEGGGIAIRTAAGPVIVSRCRFLGNGQVGGFGFSEFGGGISARSAMDLRVDDCLFAGNRGGRGGAIWASECPSVEVTSSTFADNLATQANALLALSGFSVTTDIRVANCVFRNPVGITSPLVRARRAGTTLELASCTLPGGMTALELIEGATLTGYAAIVDADPAFADPTGPDGFAATLGDNDYSLGAGSPSIDAGDNGRIAADLADLDGDGNTAEEVPFDLTGRARRVDDPGTPDTGVGTAPLVDHGAYERQ